MQKQSLDFLYSLLETPGPSGFEQGIQKVVKRRVEKYADKVTVDIHGNLIATVNPKGAVSVMLAGHCDQIGMMVTHIDDSGYLTVNQIGGIDPAVLPGTAVTIHTRKGKHIKGVIGYPPVHLVPPGDRGKPIELSKVWVDVGAKDGAQARKWIEIGDPITYELNVRRLGDNAISAPGCDDRVGVHVAMEALRIFASKIKGKKNFPVALHAVSTVQEELGLRGAKTAAYALDPRVGIAIDVTHASDNPGADAKKIGTVKLGKGPTIARGPNINPVIEAMLVETAEKKKLDFQPLSAAGATGTDANVIQISRSGVAAALIGIPCRYMHTQVEVVDLRDISLAAEIIAETVLKITPKMTFVPV